MKVKEEPKSAEKAKTVHSFFGKFVDTVKPVLSGHSKKTKQMSCLKAMCRLNAGQKYCKMLP